MRGIFLFLSLLLIGGCSTLENLTHRPNDWEHDHTKFMGVGFDRNSGVIDAEEALRELSKNDLNVTAIGFFGKDDADFFDFESAKKHVERWVKEARKNNIYIMITIAGTGGPNGGMGQAKYSDEWFLTCLNIIKELGPEGIIVVPVVEADIKEGSNPATRAKFNRWYQYTAQHWQGLKAWNFQSQPHPNQVPAGWIGVCHPQRWTAGFPGQIMNTDAPINPPITIGQYPQARIIPDSLTELARQTRARGMGFIYWEQWEHDEINKEAIKAVSRAF